MVVKNLVNNVKTQVRVAMKDSVIHAIAGLPAQLERGIRADARELYNKVRAKTRR